MSVASSCLSHADDDARRNVPQSASALADGACADTPRSAAMCHPAPPCNHASATDCDFGKTNPPLTDRQRAVARMLALGFGSSDIAAVLKINRHTVGRWKRDPRMRAEIDRLHAMVERSLADALARMRKPRTNR